MRRRTIVSRDDRPDAAEELFPSAILIRLLCNLGVSAVNSLCFKVAAFTFPLHRRNLIPA